MKETVRRVYDYTRLLILTVRVGGETIDGILLEFAVLLTHLRSLEPCSESNARELHRSPLAESRISLQADSFFRYGLSPSASHLPTSRNCSRPRMWLVFRRMHRERPEYCASALVHEDRRDLPDKVS